MTREGAAPCTTEQNQAHKRNHTARVQLRDLVQVLLKIARHLSPESLAQSVRLSRLRLRPSAKFQFSASQPESDRQVGPEIDLLVSLAAVKFNFEERFLSYLGCEDAIVHYLL